MVSGNRRVVWGVVCLALCSFDHVTGQDQSGSSLQGQSLLAASGVEGGLIVQVGCDQPQTIAALYANDRYLVQGLDRDPQVVKIAREQLQALGIYGPVSVRHWNSDRLPYADNTVNLLVVKSGQSVAGGEITRVLVPRGIALVQGSLQEKGLESVTSSPDGLNGWNKYRKPRPADIDEWTHYLHDSGNNAVAEDQRVGPPRHLQWKAEPMWSRSHEFASSIQTLVSAGGRLIGLIDEGIIGQPRGVPTFWTLIARDAFNGKLLWRRPCDQIRPHALVANGDRIYVTLTSKGPLSILDAATGATLTTCAQTGKVHELSLCDNRLILCCELRKPQRGLYIAAADPEDGRLVWSHSATAVVANTLVAGDGVVCYSDGEQLICLSLATGEELWCADAKMKKGYAVLYGKAVFLTGGSTRAYSLKDGQLLWTGPDGNPHARNPPGLFGANGLIWCAWGKVDPRSFVWQAHTETREGYAPLTGEVRKTIRAERLVTAGHHIRCYPPKATSHYLLLNKRGVEFFDLQGTGHMRANWTRGACGYGMLPANGLLYTPPSQCFCYQGVLLTGFNALAASIETPPRAESAAPAPRLTRGPAFGAGTAEPAAGRPDSDWPTYRHDVYRSGTIDASLPIELDRLWASSLCPPAFPRPAVADGEAPPVDGQQVSADTTGTMMLRERPVARLTPPVAVGERVFVAEPEAHTVHALRADDGKPIWQFVADGRVDSPPTLDNGLCLFGSSDGHVYCVDAATGDLVWKFRAAPQERQLCVMDQLESAWPVHGSVLVRDGKVYVTAGRSSFLDGGIYLYALDPATGEVIHQTRLRSDDPDVNSYGGRPFDMEGARSDILVAGQEDLYLYQNRFHADLTPAEMPRITKLGDRRCEPHLMTTDGFLDTTWFNRTYWMYGARWPGYYFSYRAPKSGQMIVFDESTTYALKVYTERRGHSPEFQPGGGYLLVADRNTTEPVLDEMDIGAEKGRGFSRTELPIWSERIPIRAHGMLLARDHLYVVGAPDLESPQDAYEAMIGKRGAIFRVVSAADGSTLSEFKLPEAPVFDGLIAAGDQLYMSSLDGTVICWGAKR